MTDMCHHCEKEFTKVATHWVQSDCPYPELSDKQHEIIKGLTLGDGCVSLPEGGRWPHMIVGLTNRQYLRHLSEDVFASLSNGVNLWRSAKEISERHRSNGFNEGAKVENYSDIYKWKTKPHPELQQYREWYSSGEKVFPEDLELTPTALKHYFVGDGSFNSDKETVSISLNNERENRSKIESIFERAGITDFKWQRYERPDARQDNAQIVFRQGGTENFFDYIGRDPLPGFGYKFPD